LRGGLIDARVEPGERRGLALKADGQAFGMAVFGPRRRTIVIPTATVDRAAATLSAKGYVARGYLGLSLQPVKLAGGD
jgi:S1-C subfamily serine protease